GLAGCAGAQRRTAVTCAAVAGREKAALGSGFFIGDPRPGALLDLRFLEDDVLARDGIVFLQLELLGLGPRVLLGDVIESGLGRADELDEDGIGLRHDGYPMRKIAGLRRTIAVLARLSSKGRQLFGRL